MTPKIDRLIEAVKFFAGSQENQIRPTTLPWGLGKVKAELLKLAHEGEAWKFEDWKPPP
jgi:hypothetical protein